MLKKSIFFTFGPEQTRKAGKVLAEDFLKKSPRKKALVLGLVGDLGGGKTTFLQGFAKGLGVKKRVLSPTFVIMRKMKASSKKRFYHLDCYRIKKSKDILDLDFNKIISDPENIVAIEWADKIMDILPESAIMLKLDYVGSSKRRIECALKK